MGEIVEGLDRERIAALRSAGRFFWADVPLTAATAEEVAGVFGMPDHALRPLVAFGDDVGRVRKFHLDADHVVFPFGCFLGTEPIEVHVVVSGEYLLTVHREAVALPRLLEVEAPEGRSE